MPKVVTPARLVAAAGVATGLAAAATSLAGIFTVGSSTGNAIVASAGVLGTIATVFKFLSGQSAWETQLLHEHSFRGANLPALPGGDPVCEPGTDFHFDPDPELVANLQAQENVTRLALAPDTAELPGEQPLNEGSEPERLVQQLAFDESTDPSA